MGVKRSTQHPVVVKATERVVEDLNRANIPGVVMTAGPEGVWTIMGTDGMERVMQASFCSALGMAMAAVAPPQSREDLQEAMVYVMDGALGALREMR